VPGCGDDPYLHGRPDRDHVAVGDPHPAERHGVGRVHVIGGTAPAGQGQAAGDVVVMDVGLEHVRYRDTACGSRRQDPDPLLRHLLDSGLARPDPLRLGLDTDPRGAVCDAAGRPASDILTLGPLLRGRRYETTAIPEIRGQAAALARQLLARQADTHPASAA
jgi:hypothetical protein